MGFFSRALTIALFALLSISPVYAAGTIFGLPLSQQIGENGEPLSGAKLYLYAAGTSTPADAFEDFGLTAGNELPHPIVADSAGRLPEFWVEDGDYRVRLTDSDGNEIFDINSTTALGPSSGTGGGGDQVSESAIFQTGDIMWQPVSGTRSGWVRANGRTIGSSSSGATERANADTEALFLFLWNNFSDSLCPVSGGRGANAAADWAANKTIGTLDMRGRLAYGLDDMGNTAASVVAAATSAAVALGQEEKAIAQANLPNVNWTHSLTAATHTHTGPSHTHTGPSHTHDGTTSSNGSHTHSYTESDIDNDTRTAGGGDTNSGGGSSSTSSNGAHTHTFTTDAGGTGATGASGTGNTGASGALTVSGTVSSGGSGTAFDTLSPGRAGSWYLSL